MKRLTRRSVAAFLLIAMAGLSIANSCGHESPEEVSEGQPETTVSASDSVATERTMQTGLVEESPVGQLAYEILNEEVYDAPIKTQVVLEILVSGSITAEPLEKLLRTLYDEIVSRRGFQYHTNPTNVYIYAFTTRERAASGMGQWIAMIDKSFNDTSPEFSINERQLEQLGAEPETRQGLSEEERIKIFQEIVRAEDRAREEAMRRYPDLIPGQPGYSQDAFMAQLYKQMDEQDRLTEVYKDQVAAKYGLTREQLKEIVSEGLLKDWPLPPLSG